MIVRKPLEPVAYWNFNETAKSPSPTAPERRRMERSHTDRAPDRADPGPSAAFAPFGAANSIEFHDE